jgi:hypothetical protein
MSFSSDVCPAVRDPTKSGDHGNGRRDRLSRIVQAEDNDRG